MSAKASKGFKDGHVNLTVEQREGRYGESVSAKISTALTPDDARALAGDLIRLADALDAKAAAERAREERRQKWREREIAAGRMRIMSPREFFNR